MEKLTKEMHAFLTPGSGLPLLLIPEYSGINKEQRIHDRSKTTHRKPPVKCFLTVELLSFCLSLIRFTSKTIWTLSFLLIMVTNSIVDNATAVFYIFL